MKRTQASRRVVPVPIRCGGQFEALGRGCVPYSVVGVHPDQQSRQGLVRRVWPRQAPVSGLLDREVRAWGNGGDVHLVDGVGALPYPSNVGLRDPRGVGTRQTGRCRPTVLQFQQLLSLARSRISVKHRTSHYASIEMVRGFCPAFVLA